MDVKASQVAASTATKSSANVGASASTGGQECAGCGKHITDRYHNVFYLYKGQISALTSVLAICII